MRSGATNTSLNSTALLIASNAGRENYSLPKTAVNFHKMKKGLFSSKRDYPGINKSDFKPSRNPELTNTKDRYETYGAANETVTSNLLS